MKYYWVLFEILKICLSDLSHLDAIALVSFNDHLLKTYLE